MFEEVVRKRNKRPRCEKCAEPVRGEYAFWLLADDKGGKILVCPSCVNKYLEDFLVVIDDETV